MITLDFETRSAADLIRWGQRRYALDSTTSVLCLCWQYDEEPTDGPVHLWHRNHEWIKKSKRPDELIRRIKDGEPVEAHNAGFEFNIWNEALRREFPEFDVELDPEQMYCSAAKASCMSLPRGLEDAVTAVNLLHHKVADGKRLINKLSKPLPRRGKKRGDGVIEFCEEEAEHRKNWLYCQGDVRAERGLSDFCPEMTKTERRYWLMDFRMNLRGIALDRDAAETGLKLARSEAERLNNELFEITQGRVAKGSQRDRFKLWANERLEDLGEDPLANTKADTLSFKLDGVPTKAGDETRESRKDEMKEKWDALGEDGALVARAMRICMEVNRSSVAKYKRMLQSVCPDERLHDIMLYNGADRTGRWSGKGVQPHNFVRGYGAGYKGRTSDGLDEMEDAWRDISTLDPELITLCWGDPMVCLAKACRGALVASKGKELYAADFNAIEARKLAWLSGCATMLTIFNTKGEDIYCDMATGIYGRKITKADKDERQMGKKAVLGLGYAMGWEKFQATVYAEEGIWLEDEFCQMVVSVYRKKKYPEVPALWQDAEKAAVGAVLAGDGTRFYAGGDAFGNGSVCYFMSADRNFLHCELPSGRLLAYLYPRVSMRVTYRFPAINERGKPTKVMVSGVKKSVPMHRVRWKAEKLAEKQRKKLLSDPPESFVSPHLSFMGRDTYTKQWKRCGTHGGSLVENFDQASSRDLLAEAMFRVDEIDDFDLLLSIHDEVIAEAPIGTCKVNEFEAIMAEVPKWAPGMPITAEGWIGSRLRK